VHKETHRGWAPIGGRDAWTENPPDETERLWVCDNEKSQTRNEGSDELLLLLSTVTSTATIFKKTHD